MGSGMKLIPAQTRSLSKMYGHFAVAAVTLTTLLAVMADGANNGAFSEELEERETKTQLQVQDASRFGTKELWRVKPKGSFGSESDGALGEPTDRVGGHSNSGVLYPQYAASMGTPYVPAAYTVLGITEAEWNALSEEERQRLLEQLQAGKKAADTAREDGTLAKLAADSRKRAGAGNFD